jgi:hypothetical protein
MRIAVLLAVAGVFATVAAQAQEEYKSIRRAEAQAAWARSGMPIYDFLGDAKSLMGKTVSVRGVAECLTDIHCYLRDPENPTLQVAIEPSALSRNELQKLLACHTSPVKCQMTITGLVAENASGELRLIGKTKP